MKKQILFIVFLVLAVSANLTKSYGQSVHNSIPIPLVCTNDPLHPIAGKPYSYDVVTNPSGGNYTWWATKDANFISTATSVTTTNIGGMLTSPTITASANYGAPNAASSVTITWSSSVLAGTKYRGVPATGTPTFVAVYYTPPAAAGNCADNFKVFELDPKKGFTVDIQPMDEVTKLPLGYTATDTQCFANVSFAQYTPGAGPQGQMEYKYGVNILYYEVVASNFTAQWKPQFSISGLQTDQTAVIEWDYSPAFASPNTVTTGVLSAQAATTTATDTSNGVSIYVRVTITNNHFEGLNDTQIALAVDGQDNDGNWDVRNDDCTLPATNIADLYDVAYHNLLKRPSVTPGTTSATSPNITIIPKNP